MNTSLKHLEIKQKDAFLVNGRSVDLDFKALSGCFNFLVGNNGVGKSTFFTHLKIKHESLGGLRPAFMDQAPLKPLADLRVEDALQTVTEEVIGAMKWSDVKACEDLGIRSLLKKPIHGLSGGENQKVKLALAMLRPFDILFADEPLQNLDRNSQVFFIQFFEGLVQQGKILVLIEHDVDKYAGVRMLVNKMEKNSNRVMVSHA